MKPKKLKKMHRIAKELQDFLGDNCEVRWEVGRLAHRPYNLRVKSKPGITGYVDEVIASCWVSQREETMGDTLFAFGDSPQRLGSKYYLQGSTRKLVLAALEEHPWMKDRLRAFKALLGTSI